MSATLCGHWLAGVCSACPESVESTVVPTPEERAAELVTIIPDGDWAHAVELRGPGQSPFRVFHAPNPPLVREAAESVRRFVAAAIRESSGR